MVAELESGCYIIGVLSQCHDRDSGDGFKGSVFYARLQVVLQDVPQGEERVLRADFQIRSTTG